jgi:hypothetical protein
VTIPVFSLSMRAFSPVFVWLVRLTVTPIPPFLCLCLKASLGQVLSSHMTIDTMEAIITLQGEKRVAGCTRQQTFF